jgi:hypothetical protein
VDVERDVKEFVCCFAELCRDCCCTLSSECWWRCCSLFWGEGSHRDERRRSSTRVSEQRCQLGLFSLRPDSACSHVILLQLQRHRTLLCLLCCSSFFPSFRPFRPQTQLLAEQRAPSLFAPLFDVCVVGLLLKAFLLVPPLSSSSTASSPPLSPLSPSVVDLQKR